MLCRTEEGWLLGPLVKMLSVIAKVSCSSTTWIAKKSCYSTTLIAEMSC
jgi:hypothetical protein